MGQVGNGGGSWSGGSDVLIQGEWSCECRAPGIPGVRVSRRVAFDYRKLEG